MPASPIASNYPLNERWAPLAVNGTRAPLQRKLRDQPKLARKVPKTNRSPKWGIWVIYMPRTYLPSLLHSQGHSGNSGSSPAQLPTSRNPPAIQFTWLFQQKIARNVSEFHQSAQFSRWVQLLQVFGIHSSWIVVLFVLMVKYIYWLQMQCLRTLSLFWYLAFD